MTENEAKEWIDNHMSAGGSWSDAQSLAGLVNKTRSTEKERILKLITECANESNERCDDYAVRVCTALSISIEATYLTVTCKDPARPGPDIT